MVDVLVNGLTDGAAFGLIAIGISLVFGVANVINFAQGSTFALGAMLGWLFVARFHWPLVLAIVAVVGLCAVVGVVIDALAVRPLADRSRVAALLGTLAVGLVLDRGMQLGFGPQARAFPSPIPHGNLHVGAVHVAYVDLVILATAALAAGALAFFLGRTRVGRAVRASAQDRDAARQMGIDTGRMGALVFALASGIAGLAGILIGIEYRNVSPSMAASATVDGFAAAALGGLGNVPGAVAGGLLLGIAENLGVTYVGGAMQQLVAFGVLLAVLWFRPGGLFGRPSVDRIEPLTQTFIGHREGRPPRNRIVAAGVAAGVLALAFGAFADDYALRVGSLVWILALVGLSLTVALGTSGIVSLGQAGFVAIGGYASALLTKELGWSFWFALPAAGLGAALVAAIAVTPVLRLRGHDVAIATLAIGAGIVAAILNAPALTAGPEGIAGIPPARLLGHDVVSARAQYWLALVVLALAGSVVLRLQRSQLGLAWRAIREDEIAAAASAIDPAAGKATAFVVGAALAGVAGALLVQQYGYVSPDMFGVELSVLGLVIVVLGGLGSVPGAVLAAIALVALPEVLRPLHEVRAIAYGALLLLLVRVRPAGLLPYR